MYFCWVKSEKENKDTTITFRLNEELKRKLEMMSDKEQRSLSNFIVYLLEKFTKEKK